MLAWFNQADLNRLAELAWLEQIFSAHSQSPTMASFLRYPARLFRQGIEQRL